MFMALSKCIYYMYALTDSLLLSREQALCNVISKEKIIIALQLAKLIK